MSVALHARHAESGLRGQILEETDRAHIRQIFSAQHGRLTIAAQLREDARVHHALENALAVLVARARVAQRERGRQTRELRVAFINDDRRPVRPRAHEFPDCRTQRHAPVPWLLDVEQARPQVAERRRREQVAEIAFE